MIQVDGIFVQQGGGSGSIAFDVQTAEALPGTVVDGQIVVLTGVAPAKVTFSYTVPTDPAAGDIWIHIVDNNGYAITSGDNQAVVITPGVTMQYSDGAWAYRKAYAGVSGSWQMFSTDTPLINATWEQVVGIANSGEDVSQFWAVGDRCPLSLTGGETVYAQIAGFLHDNLADGGGLAAITFSFEDCISTTYGMNASNTNSGGWNGSRMRTSTLPTLLAQFPAVLQDSAGIKTVNKIASAGSQSSNLITSPDRLWLFSTVEVTGSAQYSASGEGTIYPLFSTAANRIKGIGAGGAAAIWWLRSPRANYSTGFVDVLVSGSVSASGASDAFGVAPGFCV